MTKYFVFFLVLISLIGIITEQSQGDGRQQKAEQREG